MIYCAGTVRSAYSIFLVYRYIYIYIILYLYIKPMQLKDIFHDTNCCWPQKACVLAVFVCWVGDFFTDCTMGFITIKITIWGICVSKHRTSKSDLCHPFIRVGLYGGFLKWWYPTTMGFPTKNDHFGVFWEYHYFRKHPYGSLKECFMIHDNPSLGNIYPLN